MTPDFADCLTVSQSCYNFLPQKCFPIFSTSNYSLHLSQGRGGPLCEFRLHVQSDRTVMLEGVKSPLQFVTLQENGKLGDPRSVLDKDPAKRFHVYVRVSILL